MVVKRSGGQWCGLIAWSTAEVGIGTPIGGGTTAVVWTTVVGTGIEPNGVFILLSVVTTIMGGAALT